jgi:hypothetical protein
VAKVSAEVNTKAKMLRTRTFDLLWNVIPDGRSEEEEISSLNFAISAYSDRHVKYLPFL